MISLSATAASVHKKWSTWLGLLSASCAAGLLAINTLPQSAQDAFPHSMLSAMAVITVMGPLLIPLATSLKQANIPEA